MSLIMFTGNLHAIISAILRQLVLFCKWKILHICKYSNIRDLTSLNVVTLALKKEKSLEQRCHSHRIMLQNTVQLSTAVRTLTHL